MTTITSTPVPNAVLVDSFCQVTFPIYEHLMSVYETPRIQTQKDWAAASAMLREAFERTISEVYPLLSARLKRTKETGNRVVAYDFGSCPPILSFAEISDWAPSRESIATNYLEGWQVGERLQALPVDQCPYMSSIEEQVSMIVKFTWAHKDGRSFVMIYYNRSHFVMDGTAHALFRLHFARMHREMVAERDGTAEALKEIPRPPLPTFDHQCFGRTDVKLPKDYTPGDCRVFLNALIVLPLMKLQRFFRRTQPRRVIVRVRFPRSTLLKMHEEVAEYARKTSDGKPFTTNDVLASFWMKLHYTLTGQKSASFDIPVNIRDRFPGVGPHHVGSGLVHAMIDVKNAHKLSWGELAVMVHDKVREESSVESIQRRCDWEAQRTNVKHGFYLGGDLSVFHAASSWRHFPMYNPNTTFGGLMGDDVPVVVAPFNIDGGNTIFMPPPPNQNLGEDMLLGTDIFYGLPKTMSAKDVPKVRNLLPVGAAFVGQAEKLAWI